MTTARARFMEDKLSKNGACKRKIKLNQFFEFAFLKLNMFSDGNARQQIHIRVVAQVFYFEITASRGYVLQCALQEKLGTISPPRAPKK